MTLNVELAWYAVSLMALLMLLQALIVFILFTRAAKYLRTSQKRLYSLIAGIGAGTTALRQLLAHTERVPEKLAELEKRIPEVRAQATQLVNNFALRSEALVDRSRSYLYRIDEGADNVLSNYSTQIFRVHRAIVHPAIRLSTLLQSIQTIVSRVFPGGESPASHSPDQEIFI
ncbi:MAG TPA: hypothetical protein PLP42_22605 [Acidobacteriota bacterium]|nr:hypothetical protein [Acidobacteriota bacterium]